MGNSSQHDSLSYNKFVSSIFTASGFKELKVLKISNLVLPMIYLNPLLYLEQNDIQTIDDQEIKNNYGFMHGTMEEVE